MLIIMDIIKVGSKCAICNRAKTKTGRYRNFGRVDTLSGLSVVVCYGCYAAARAMDWDTYFPEKAIESIAE